MVGRKMEADISESEVYHRSYYRNYGRRNESIESNNGAYPKHGWSPYFAMGNDKNFLGRVISLILSSYLVTVRGPTMLLLL